MPRRDWALRGVPRTIAKLLFAVELAGIAWLVLNPSPSAPGRAVYAFRRLATALGLPAELTTPAVWEFLLNVALFVPLTFLAVLLWPRPGVVGWTTLSGVLTMGLEATQLLLLPTRSPTVSDLVANTGGGFVGAFLAAVALRVFPGRAQAVLGLFLGTVLAGVATVVLAFLLLPVPVLQETEASLKELIKALVARAAAKLA